MTTSSTMVIGVGSGHRSDDGVGLAVGRRLREMAPDVARVTVKEGDLVSLLDEWRGADLVVLVDAMASRSTPGTIRRYDAHARPLPSVFVSSSTHAFGVAEAIELARSLEELPARVVVFGVEGRSFGVGDRLSPEVDAAIGEVLKLVIAEVRAARQGDGGVAP